MNVEIWLQMVKHLIKLHLCMRDPNLVDVEFTLYIILSAKLNLIYISDKNRTVRVEDVIFS